MNEQAEFPVAAEELERALRRHVVDVWYPRCIDEEYGGFLCDFDRRWRPCGPHAKLLEFQARQTWFAAAALEVYPDDPSLRRAAVHGLHYLNGPLWDSEQGGWYHRLDRGGKPLAGATKHAHGIAYAITACAAAGKMLNDPAARELARTGFEWLDAHAHDRVHGAYLGLMDRDGKPVRTPGGSWPGGIDPIGTPLGCKDANVHNDLIEAFLWLYEVWPDARVLERLAETVEFLTQYMMREDGGLRYHARADGAPISDYIQYGQGFQAAYRVLRARDLLGDHETGAREAVRLLDFALEEALDGERGGYRHSNFQAPEAPAPVSKQWWIQAECIHALAVIIGVFPDDRRYTCALSDLWSYVQGCLFDPRHGGLYSEPRDVLSRRPEIRNAPGELRDMTRKGSEWKYAGHEGLALLSALQRASRS